MRDSQSNITIGLATTPEAKQEVFRLRYKSLKKTGWIGPSSSRYIAEGKVEDKYDHYPKSHARIFTLHQNDKLVGSMRSCCQLWQPHCAPQYPLPACSRFTDELNEVVPADTWVVGISKLIIFNEASGRQELKMLYELFSCVSFMLRQSSAESLIATVQPRHARYYTRLGLAPVSPPKPELELEHDTQLLHGLVSDHFDTTVSKMRHLETKLPYGAKEW